MWIFNFILCLTLSASTNHFPIDGLWVDINNQGIIYFAGDSITTVSLVHHHEIIGRYKFKKDSIIKIKVYKEYQNPIVGKRWESRISLMGDTLVFHGQDTFRLIKSKYSDFYDHYANDQNMRVDLPYSTIKDRRQVHEKCIDIFIGYSSNSQVSLKVNDSQILNINEIDRILMDFKQSLTYPINIPLCRLFVDKSLPMSYVVEVQEKLREYGIRRLMYVSKDPGHEKHKTTFDGLIIVL